MIEYKYYRATKLADISEKLLLHSEGSEQPGLVKILAGGTDLLVQIFEKDRALQNLTAVIDISSLTHALRYIREEQDHIRIGALATHTDIGESPIIAKHIPFLQDACNTVGSPQIRNKGTLGGCICNASPAADPLPPLVVAGTVVVIQGPRKTRKLSIEEFYLGKGAVSLEAGEFVKEFIVQKIPQTMNTAFIKVGRRKALAIARLNVAVAVQVHASGIIEDVRIAPGCIFIKPHRVTSAEDALFGKKAHRRVCAQAGILVGKAMIEETGVRWSTEYKLPAIEGIVEEALLRAMSKEDR